MVVYDSLLRTQQKDAPIPPGYNTEDVLAWLSAWERAQRVEHEQHHTLERRAALKFMMKVEDKNRGGVYKPIYNKEQYSWITSCMPTLHTQKLLWEKGFVVDAIGNPNGRCLWYALSQSMTDASPTSVRDKTMESLFQLLEKQFDDFKNAASIFLHEEDEKENASNFARWFSNVAGIEKGSDETDREYHKRVRLFSLNLESVMRRKRYFFLVTYLSNCQRMYSSALVFLAFFHAYPQKGIQLWRVPSEGPSEGSLNRYLSQPDENDTKVNFAFMLYAGDHFTLLRKSTDVDVEPAEEPKAPGRPLGSSGPPPAGKLSSQKRPRKQSEKEEQEDVWDVIDRQGGIIEINDDDDDSDAMPAPKRLDPALCAPVSSASAERIGFRLRKLGEFDRMLMVDTAMQRNLYFSGNGIYTDQMVSIASYRATLSEGPVPPAAPMVPIKDDQQRSLPEKPVNKIIEKLQREIESLKRQLGQVQPTPKGAPQPDATSIKRFFTLSTVKIPAPQQKPPAVSAGTAPELRTKEAADALIELANPHTDNKGLGKRHRHAAVSDASNECEDSDEAVEDGEDIVLELEDEDEDASADNIDTGFSRKKPKNTKSSKSTNSSSKKNKKT
jgi:hypothetical protein